MKRKILFYFHDVGGLNFCLPLISALSDFPGFSLDILCSGPSLAHAKARGVAAKAAKITNSRDIVNILNKSKPDLIVTGTSRLFENEIAFWKAAKRAQAVSICVVDYWMDHKFRFEKNRKYFFPDLIVVPDESVAAEIKAGFNLKKTEVVVCGHPHLELLKNYIPSYDKSVFCQNTGLRHELPAVSYFSDTISNRTNKKLDRTRIYEGINEKTALSLLIKALNDLYDSGQECQLIIKHHPSEAKDNLLSIVSEAKENIIVTLVDAFDSREIICHSDVVFSIFGMPIIEAAAMGKPVFSICNNKIEESVWKRFPFRIPVVKSKEQIRDSIANTLSSRQGNYRMGIIENFGFYGSTQKAVDLVARLMR